eukprot:3158287-Ditylum_brightwellii.AAC.1
MAPGLSKIETGTFFLKVALMDVNSKTLSKLGKEGIIEVKAFGKFKKALWKQVADNLQCLSGQMKNLDKGANKRSTVPRNPFVFGANMQKRLLEASELARYYKLVDQVIMVSGVEYNPVIRSFMSQWRGLTDRRKNPSQFSLRSLQNCPSCIGWRTTMLATRPSSLHAKDLPHAKEFASIEEEHVFQASHTHVIYCKGNADVRFSLEEATSGTQYASSIKPF